MKTQTQKTNPLFRLLDATREAYLQQREAARKPRRICAPGEATPRPRPARRPPLVSLPGHPAPVTYAPIAEPAAPAPVAVPPAPTIATAPAGCAMLKPARHSALLALVAAIDVALASATKTSATYTDFAIGRTRYRIRPTFENLQRFRAKVIKHRTAFADKALA